MLDTETKRRIDTARDILVGKVPDPKSQVEQITIALIYKFMDDMDQQSLNLGGKASFFSGEFEKYAWNKIFDPHLGGYEMLALYADAITRMSLNPNLPQLFRDIFKNAYLPYRDPETLKLFLKTIHEFSYDHSERLGDAFEYLLSVLGSQGDAGQFRTPRHIIDFMVKAVKPQKNETILDPACGTAGFLISAYKYILSQNTAKQPGDLLTHDERERLLTNFKGYDISPDMVRLSLVNLYLHGFVQPQIYEYDTLTNEDRWHEYADVILANPPFMSPKGGIKPHKHFSVQSNRSEVLFVDYMAEHLTPTGRAGIIVPEGIIFQSAGAYKQLRKYLVEQNYLWAVVSLPAGVFNPYAGVKTSILLLDRALAKKTDQILFLKVEADGFDLGAQRKPGERNDLPDALNVLDDWHNAVANGKLEVFDPQNRSCEALLVEKSRLAEGEEYNLSGERYREVQKAKHQKWPVVPLGELCESILSGGTPSTAIEEFWNGDIPWITSADIQNVKTALPRRHINADAIKNSATNLIPKGNIIVVTRVGLGKLFLNDFDVCISQDSQGLILKKQFVVPEFLLYILSHKVQIFKTTSQGSTIQGVTKSQLSSLEIPLPPLEIQRQIVAEIEGYQCIIDGARQVVENWKPNIELELEEERKKAGVEAWEITKLNDLCDVVRGSSPRPKHDKRFYNGPIPRLMVADVTRDGMYVTPQIDSLTEEGAKQSRWMKKGDLIMAVSGQPGLCGILSVDACIHDGFAGFRNLKNEMILTEFAYYYLMSQRSANNSQSVGAIFLNLNTDQLRKFEIPVPPINIQRTIIEHIETEREIIESNRKLVDLYNAKIKKAIERVWEG
jgi:type I restriction enzyme M protein